MLGHRQQKKCEIVPKKDDTACFRKQRKADTDRLLLVGCFSIINSTSKVCEYSTRLNIDLAVKSSFCHLNLPRRVL